MPTRNIYLTEDDVETYNKAKEKLGKGNLSRYIVSKLKEFNDGAEKIEGEEFPSYILYLGEKGNYKKARISGTLLSSFIQNNEKEYIEYQIYITQRHKILLYERASSLMNQNEKAAYKVFDSIEELNLLDLPGELLAVAVEKLNLTESEFLDL